MNNITLERVGSTLINRDNPAHTFKICERLKTTPSKSNHFLLQKRPTEKYISSLWPVDASGNVFEFETEGIRHTLTLETNVAQIRPSTTRRTNGHV